MRTQKALSELTKAKRRAIVLKFRTRTVTKDAALAELAQIKLDFKAKRGAILERCGQLCKDAASCGSTGFSEARCASCAKQNGGRHLKSWNVSSNPIRSQWMSFCNRSAALAKRSHEKHAEAARELRQGLAMARAEKTYRAQQMFVQAADAKARKAFAQAKLAWVFACRKLGTKCPLSTGAMKAYCRKAPGK